MVKTKTALDGGPERQDQSDHSHWGLGRKLRRLTAPPAVFSHLRFSLTANDNRPDAAYAEAAAAAWVVALTSSGTPGPIAVDTEIDLQ